MKMAKKKEYIEESKTDMAETVSVFSKEQFLNSNSYRQYRDFLNAALNDTKTYTKEQVENMINKFYGKVGK